MVHGPQLQRLLKPRIIRLIQFMLCLIDQPLPIQHIGEDSPIGLDASLANEKLRGFGGVFKGVAQGA